MGLFNSYLKEGPGVEKDAPKKKGIFLFFEVFGRKFFKLMQANILYFLVSIPFLALALFVLAPMVSKGLGISDAILALDDGEYLSAFVEVILTVLIFNMFGSGPAGAGYAYVTRCFTRCEHAWIASDGFDKIKENIKNSLLLLVFDVVVIILAANGAYFYSNIDILPGFLSAFFKYVILLIFIIYMFAHIFAYQIMVTYECKFRAVVKNSIILAIAKIPMCILLSAIAMFIYLVLANYTGLLSIVIYAIVGMSVTRFPLEFYAARVIEKNIENTNKSNEGAE